MKYHCDAKFISIFINLKAKTSIFKLEQAISLIMIYNTAKYKISQQGLNMKAVFRAKGKELFQFVVSRHNKSTTDFTTL